MKAPYIKVDDTSYPAECLDFYKGELFSITYRDEEGKIQVLYKYDVDLEKMLKEGEQHERVS